MKRSHRTAIGRLPHVFGGSLLALAMAMGSPAHAEDAQTTESEASDDESPESTADNPEKGSAADTEAAGSAEDDGHAEDDGAENDGAENDGVETNTGSQLVVIAGNDEELVDAVAAELRAAGFDVVFVPPQPNGEKEATIVSIERVGGSVVVHASRPDGDLDAELPESTDADGMADRDATALRTAEAIRSMVNTPKKKSTPKAPKKSKGKGAKPPPVLHAPVVPSPTYGKDDVDPDLQEIPVLRAGIMAGGGMVGDDPSLTLGLSLRGQVTPHFNVSAHVLGTRSVFEKDFNDNRFDIYGARGAVVANWEILGAHNSWTPSIGGGFFGEYRSWEGTIPGSPSPCPEPYLCVQGFPSEEHLEGSMGGAGLIATAGISVARPWRFRFDVMADLRMVTVELDGNGHDYMIGEIRPTVLATFGLEFDFITRGAPSKAKQTAKR